MSIELKHKSISKSNPLKVELMVYQDGEILLANKIDIGDADKRERFVVDVAGAFPGLDVDELKQKLLKLTEALLDDEKDKPSEIETPLMLSKKKLDETEDALVDMAKEFLKKPNLIQLILQHVRDLGVVNEVATVLALFLCFVSRLLSKPIALVVLGASSSGKSLVIAITASTIPPEAVLLAHRMTPAALAYLPEGTLIHRAVVCGERSRNTKDDAAETTRSLREMLSDGTLRLCTTQKDSHGNLVTRQIEQPGPISYVESTTLGSSEIFDEDKTRFILVCADESERQSRAIMERLAGDAMAPKNVEDRESILALHHTAQRLLQPRDVVIPYASFLTSAMPCRRPESRRAFGHLLGLIKACALLHQYQRQTDGGKVVASRQDYEIVREYMTTALGRGLGVDLTAGADSLMEAIEEHYNFGDTFTAADLKEQTGLGRCVYDRLKELRSRGLLKMEPGAGNQGARYQLNPTPEDASGLKLPDLPVEEIKYA